MAPYSDATDAEKDWDEFATKIHEEKSALLKVERDRAAAVAKAEERRLAGESDFEVEIRNAHSLFAACGLQPWVLVLNVVETGPPSVRGRHFLLSYDRCLTSKLPVIPAKRIRLKNLRRHLAKPKLTVPTIILRWTGGKLAREPHSILC